MGNCVLWILTEKNMNSPPHAISGRKTSRVPRHHVCIWVDSSDHGDRATGPSKRADKVTVHYGTIDASGYTHSTVEITDSSTHTVWDILSDVCRPKHTTWVWVYDLIATTSMLGISREAVSGTWRWMLSRDTMQAQGWAPDEVWTGKLVTADPPCWMELRSARNGANIVMVDIRNYSVRQCTSADQLLTWVTDYCDMVRAYDLGPLSKTASGQGLASYRRRRGSDLIYSHRNNSAAAAERLAYSGGLCQVFRAGECPGPIYVYDCRSSYPAICAEYELPCSLIGSVDASDGKISGTAHVPDWLVVDVSLVSPKSLYPVRIGQRTVMARGNIRTWLHSPEYENALIAGHVKRIHGGYHYRIGTPLQDVSTHLLSCRSRAVSDYGPHMASVLKSMGNGLIGKIGQRPSSWIDAPWEIADQDWGQWPSIDADTGRVRLYRSFGGRVQWYREPGVSAADKWLTAEERASIGPGSAELCDDTFTALPGAVTSIGRCILQELISRLPARSVYYCDTDCVHLSLEGHGAIISLPGYIHSGPGGWRLVSIAQRAEYLAPKVYKLDDTWTVAGLMRGAIECGDYRWKQRQKRGWTAIAYDGTDGWLAYDDVDFAPTLLLDSEVEPGGWVSAPMMR